MKRARIDVGFRVGPTTNTIQVVQPTGGALVDVTLTAGLYLTADALADEIHARLQAYSANIFCAWEPTNQSYNFGRSAGANFDLAFPQPTLRNFLGAAATYTNISALAAITPGCFVSALPWHSDTYTYAMSRKGAARAHNRASVVPLAEWSEFGITAVLKSSEAAALRVVLGYALRGLPITVYYDSSVTTAWSSTNWFGRRTCVFAPGFASYLDNWLTSPHQTLMEIPLELREFTASDGSGTGFAGAIVKAEVGVRFYCKIQGIGDIYLDGETPVGPLGAAWSAPTSKTVATYTYRPYMLDTSAGLGEVGAEISRRSGTTVPGSLTLTLADNRAAYLRTLFARDRSDGNAAHLTATLAYDTAGAGSTITVDDTTGWASTGTAFLGRETIYYDGKTGTTLDATVAGGGARDVFSIGYEDRTYVQNVDKAARRLITDWPSTWHGRYVQLFAFIVDQDGRAYDSAIDSTYSREVWRGIIQGDPFPQRDWRSWRIDTKSVDVILQTEIGREPIEGYVMQVPGDATANNAQTAGMKPFSIGAQHFAFFVSSNNNRLNLTVTSWTSTANAASDTGPTTTHYQLTIATAGTLLTEAALVSAINVAVGNVSTGAPAGGTPMGDYTSLTIKFVKSGEHAGYYFYIDQTGAGVSQVTFHFSAEGGVGEMFGFSGSKSTGHLANTADEIIQPDEPGTMYSTYIGEDDPTIPFWYAETGGNQPDLAPSSGYAKVGDEIVSYTGLSAFDDIDGMYQLTGCVRGQLGTTPKKHAVALSTDWKTDIEKVKVTFGIGFSATGFLDAVLQLATSTGSGHHDTAPYAHDALAAKVGPALNPLHFDLPAMAKVQAGLDPVWRNVSFFLSKPIKLAELLGQWLQPLNLYLTARTNAAGSYRITVDKVLPPLESEPVTTTLGAGQLDGLDPAEWRSGNDVIINRITANYMWDALKEAPVDGMKAIATEDDSEADYGIRGSLEWTFRGYPWGVGQANVNLAIVAKGVFQRFGRPYDLLTFRVDRTGWLLKPGDVITFTLTGAPAPDGSNGIDSREAVVVGVSHTYWDPGGGLGSEVTVIIERYVRRSTYCPAAKVASYNAGVPSITLTANQFSVADDTTDAAFFSNGDVVRIFNQGDSSTIDLRTLSGKTGNTFTISSALVNCTVGANTRMIATTYGNVQASQRARVFTANNSTPPVLTTSDTTAYKYV